MKMFNHDTLFVMPFHEIYLLDYLISYYGTSIPMESNQTNKSIHCHSPFMNVHELSYSR